MLLAGDKPGLAHRALGDETGRPRLGLFLHERLASSGRRLVLQAGQQLFAGLPDIPGPQGEDHVAGVEVVEDIIGLWSRFLQ